MKRRHFLGTTALVFLPARFSVASAERTPSQAEGPYYPVKEIPLNRDLVRDAKLMNGDVLHLAGRVTDLDGAPLAGVRVEIWQCDGARIYDHPAHRGAKNFDAHFAGAGADETNADGVFAFRTMLPVSYSRRPPHIHCKLRRGGKEILTSQLYLRGRTGAAWHRRKRERLQIAPVASPSTSARKNFSAQFTFVV